MKSIRRILIAQPYGIGDALFITPILRALRVLPTVEKVDLLLGSRTEAIFRNNPHVDEIFHIDKAKWHEGGTRQRLADLISLGRRLVNRYDTLIDFSLQREYSFYSQFLFHIPRRVGFNYKGRGTFLTKSIPLEGFEGRHVVDFYADLMKLLEIDVEDRFLEFYLSSEAREEASEILGKKSISGSNRFITVCPGGGESWGKDAVFKRWPVSHFVELVNSLKQKIDFEEVLILGSRGERQLGEEIQRDSGLPVVNFCGEISLETSAALLEKSVLFLANDGGLVHLAHALHVPLIAFYGPVDPRVYGPNPRSPQAVPIMRKELPCRPCYTKFRYNSLCVDRECLTELRPESVMETLHQKNFWRHCRLRGNHSNVGAAPRGRPSS